MINHRKKCYNHIKIIIITIYNYYIMSNNKGIPTIGVRGIQFRSRIEAQWAYIFEKLGWNWEYEAIDLNGYIPDFIVKFGDEDFLIEIKGNTNIWKEEVYKPHKEKIIKSGWKGKFGILGSVYKICDDWRLLQTTDLTTKFKARQISQDEYFYYMTGNKNDDVNINNNNFRYLSFHNKKINIGKLFHNVYKIPDDIETNKNDDYGILHDGKNHNDDMIIVYSEECRFCMDSLQHKDILDYELYDRNDTFTTDISEYFSKLWVEAKNKVQWKGIQTTNEIDEIEIFESFQQNLINKIYNDDFCKLKTVQDILKHNMISNIDKQRILNYNEIVKQYYTNHNILPEWKTYVTIDDIIPFHNNILHTNLFVISLDINGTIIHIEKFKSEIKDDFYDTNKICIM